MEPEIPHLSSTIHMPTNVLYEVLEDEVVLLNLTTESYFILDDIGTRMWQLLIDHHRPDLVVQQLLEEYDIDRETLRKDLSTLIGQLLDKKLLSDV